MKRAIDVAQNVAAYASQIKAAGFETVIRYYNHRNSQNLPTKRLEKDEADTLSDAGLSLAVVFQQRGGKDGNLSDLDRASGQHDAQRALELAETIGQPEGSAIYFAIDHDFWKPSDLNKIKPYFEEARKALDTHYRVGIYGSGTQARMMRDAGFVDLIWLAAAKGWSGTRDMLETDQWALFQKWPPENFDHGAFSYDSNTVSSAWPDYGQFRLSQATVSDLSPSTPAVRTPTALAEVIARSGLNLRRGPGEQFAIENSFPRGTLVHMLEHHGEWVKVDIEGDGLADGYMHGGFLRPVSGGLPIPMPPDSTPYDIAKAELVLNVAEAPGSANNPRIVAYHASTNIWAGTDDSVAWCSSFVNWCVEQSGREGTNRQNARSWVDWGQDVTGNPIEGDIVVFSRTNDGVSGHVGFFVADLGDVISVLGGNQSNRVKISNYPKDGVLGTTPYKLLTIRRG